MGKKSEKQDGQDLNKGLAAVDAADVDAEAAPDDIGDEAPPKEEKAAEAPKCPAKEEKVGKKAKHLRVKSHVNMVMRDGCELLSGQECLVHPDEHERLAKDKRGPFYDVL